MVTEQLVQIGSNYWESLNLAGDMLSGNKWIVIGLILFVVYLMAKGTVGRSIWKSYGWILILIIIALVTKMFGLW